MSPARSIYSSHLSCLTCSSWWEPREIAMTHPGDLAATLGIYGAMCQNGSTGRTRRLHYDRYSSTGDACSLRLIPQCHYNPHKSTIDYNE